MRQISFSLTTPQFIAGTKTVTRRNGWKLLKPGDRLMAVEKSQGLKKGEKVRTLGQIEIVSVRRETLSPMCRGDDLLCIELEREGFPGMTEPEFLAMFCKSHKGVTPTTEITRIEFRKL